jgi:hypothetical protein
MTTIENKRYNFESPTNMSKKRKVFSDQETIKNYYEHTETCLSDRQILGCPTNFKYRNLDGCFDSFSFTDSKPVVFSIDNSTRENQACNGCIKVIIPYEKVYNGFCRVCAINLGDNLSDVSEYGSDRDPFDEN